MTPKTKLALAVAIMAAIVIALLFFAAPILFDDADAAEPDTTGSWIVRNSCPGYDYYFDERSGWIKLPPDVHDYPWFKDYPKDQPIWGYDPQTIIGDPMPSSPAPMDTDVVKYIFSEGRPPDPDSTLTTEIGWHYRIKGSCGEIIVLHDWVDTPYKYFLGGEKIPDTWKFGPDSLSLYMYRIKGADTRKYAKIQYCRKCGILRINLEEVEK